MLRIYVLTFLFREAFAGFCTNSYSCDQTCYYAKRYTTSCGFLGWGRCTRYRTMAYYCTGTCYRQVCCAGFTGSNCDIPICVPVCQNGGRCISPNYCRCSSGFNPPNCNDINECSGANGCKHTCVNTHGSFYCSCRNGYTLSSDLKTCIDVSECNTNNGGCQHTCTNTDGSFYCQCRDGYKLNSDARTCSDVDECALGSSGCAHTCSNTVGSFRCSCRTGYTLAGNGKSCEDVDECSNGTARCVEYCNNTLGSYNCYCGTGYVIGQDGVSCKDINECSTNNGNCDQKCINLPGSFSCECLPGFRMNGNICQDIDECKELTSGCSQLCTNTKGSFTCSCRLGYFLSVNKKACLDVNNCENVTCLNGGKCVDGLNKYTCSCLSGYTGKHCETDINECAIAKGGCQDVCINTAGAFHCNCSDGGQLLPDGFSCTSGTKALTVFERNKLPQQLLPKPCFTILLAKCQDGNTIDVYLSSTSEWYTLKTNGDIIYTLGIVFIKVNSLSIPVSIRGLEVTLGDGNFEIHYGVQYGSVDGIRIINDLTPENCQPFELIEGDIFEFFAANSFIKTLLLSLFPSLPNWLRLDKTSDEVLAIEDLRSDLVYGKDMDGVSWCSGAPVIPDHLYTVFSFGSGFTLRVMEEDVVLPKPLNDNKFCLIVDLCHSYGGTIFLMIPEESRELLLEFSVFQNLKEEQNLLIHPRGIGISLTNGIYTNYHTMSLELWNGDRMFNPLLPNVDLWIGGDVIKYDKYFTLQGKADIYVGVPSVQTIFTSMFREEWTGLIDITISASPILRFKMFGKEYSITFKLITGALNVLLSIGGGDRVWCGDVSNPPGVFVSALIDISPFKGVPVLEDWIFHNTHRLYAFVNSEPVEDPFANLKISIKDDIHEVDTFVDNISIILNDVVDEIEVRREVLNSSHLLIHKVKETVVIFKEVISVNFNDLLIGNFDEIIRVLNRIRDKFIELEQIVSDFIDALEFIANAAVKNLTETIELQVNLIRRNIHRAVNTVTSTIAKSVGNYTGFGLKYTTDLKIFKLGMVGIDIEIVYSEGNLFRCSRFDKIRNLLEGEKAIRFIGRAYKGYSLGRFLKYRKGFGVGGAFSTDFHKSMIQLQAFISMIGIQATGDIFITTDGLYFYLEGNVWDIFLAQIDVSAKVGYEWYDLTYRLRGRLVAKARRKRETYTRLLASNNYLKAFKKAKRLQNRSVLDRKTHIYLNRRKRQIQTVSTSFQSSYLDALKKVISFIGDEANTRLTQVQNGITVAQNGLSKAQDWLDEKKKDVRKANVYFDNAITVLEKAKQKVEEAKGPFNEAVRKLEEAQKNVDNLCRIRTCSEICIPGIKCRICHKLVWGIRIPYPCCDFTSCMISFPDPICVLANLACRILRGIAYSILEAAKLVVRVVLVAFDIAKAALTVAQFVVDKARVVLTIAEGILELAKVRLEYAKGILEAAKVALEAVRFVIGVNVKVLEFIIEYGMKNIIDVRNCGFEIELSTKDLPVFDVFCEVNVFRLGWTKVNLTINFKNILQSIWQAARATINAFMDLLGGVFGGRKKRDIIFEASSKMHVLLRKIRESGFSNETASNWNETINIAEDIIGFSGENISDSENRIQIFKSKCKTFTIIQNFMHDAFSSMQGVVNQSKASVEAIYTVKSKLHKLNNPESMTDNITVENAGISRDYASVDFNMTEKDIETAITDTKAVAVNDPLIVEIKSAANISLESVHAEERSVESIDYLSLWFNSMKNITREYFNESECDDFKDCIFYSISTLYGLYEYETVENVTKIRDCIIDLEDNLINTFQNESTSILGAADVMERINDRINWLADINVFCAKPPRLQSKPKNITSLLRGNVTFYCDAEGDPKPTYKWFRNGIRMSDNNGNHLILTNVSKEANNTAFHCTAENVVTVVLSDVAYLIVADAGYTDTDECATDNGNCGQVCNNTIGSFECSCLSGYTLMTDGLNCMDTNECLVNNGGCDHLCENKEGTYTCSCNAGFLLDDDGISCTDINECGVNNGGCLYTCENEDGGFKCLCHDGFSFQGNGTSCEDINECSSNNGGCEDVCVNEMGSFKCECKNGYTLEENGISCQDINECYENNGGCAHRCVNEEGSYNCSCIPGFTLKDDNVSCEDINECDFNNGGCLQTCLNDAGSFRCNCLSGFLLQEDGVSCNDSNECDRKNGGCEHICVNNEGSFKCQCRSGFVLKGDSVSCSDINECDSNNGECKHRCVNDEGSYTCECINGFTLDDDGVSCFDVDECDSENGGCSQTCENTAGSFQCKCGEGFALGKDMLSCNDINECDKNNGGCAHICINQEGSFKCGCNNGFVLSNNGLLCEDINECNSNNGGCAHKCINMEGSLRCECRDGFELQKDGFSCSDIKECENNNGGCDHKCINEEGSFRCQCNDGYSIQTDGMSCNDVDECDDDNGGCEHTCVNEAGTFSCNCKDGFSLSDDGFTCIDINECSKNNGGCAHTCANINGSFECRCNEGFELQPDRRACSDINACDKNNGECEQKCENEAGSYKCQCNEGFELKEDGFTCTDINECSRNKSNCSQKCVNIAGSFECQCMTGFTLKEDKRSCADVNECVSNNGGCSHSCENEEGSFKCQCNHGFEIKSDGVSCVDINECDKNNGGCAQMCLNEAGSFKCQCENGFESQDNGFSCVDVNECEAGNGGCEHQCINEKGTHKCQCNVGYSIQTDGMSCIDDNECNNDNGGCEHTCVNEAGTFSCNCKDGFNLSDDGFTCIDVNECSKNNGGCAHTCVNINGSFECRCNEGFKLLPDRRACSDINECDKNNGECEQKCENEAGSYKCQCNEGFELQEDGFTCTDINECSRNKSNCSQKCVNIAGSFECQCIIGFTLKEDKRSCADVNECVSNNGGCSHSCENEEGSFKCQCNHGFELKSDGVSCVDLIECDKNNGGCAQMCLNEAGSFKCQCENGFESQDDGFSCVDVNECEANNGGCEHQCINEKGTHKCQCNVGYSIQTDGMSCIDDNECNNDNGGCEHTCVNEAGTFSCNCNDGFSLSDDGFTCIDINECSKNNGGCAHTCVNINGSFECRCNEGFELQPDRRACSDINECDKNNGECEQKCENEAGSYKCQCNEGFELQEDGFTCTVINECSRNKSNCSQKCVNIAGSFECQCMIGFTLKEDKRSCADVNECVSNNGGCAHSCVNEEGSFKCQCNYGFELKSDGVSCVDINECDKNNGGCAQMCLNEAGSFKCQCENGFESQDDGFSCVDVNECEANNGGCEHQCINEKGTYKCQCNVGYSIQTDGMSCIDDNECNNDNGGCEHTCVNEAGTFSCHCENGFGSQEDGISCVDIDECQAGNGGCSQICINDEGTHRCQCNDGYRLNDDGLTCEDINECEAVTDICEFSCLNFNGTFSCRCPAGYSLMDNGKSCEKLAQQTTLSSTLRLTISSEITEVNLRDLDEYNSIANKVKKALTEYIQQFTDVPFTIIINQIRFGSVVADYTIILKNATASNMAMEEIFKAVMNLTDGASVLFDGRVVQAKTVLPGNVTEPCDILELFRGSCEEGYHCKVVANIPTCSLVQGDAGNYMVYVAPAIGGLALIVLSILLTLCAMVIRKKRRNKNKKGRCNGSASAVHSYDDFLKHGTSLDTDEQFITRYARKLDYIVSVESIDSILKDVSTFWKVIWVESCRIIVMLTSSLEREVVYNFDHYLLCHEEHQDIDITCNSGSNYDDCAVRTLTVRAKTDKTTDEREITIFRYVVWSERWDPENFMSLIEFFKLVNSVNTDLHGPILVHSSAGVHRCATYIAADLLTKDGKEKSPDDVHACLQHLNRQKLHTNHEDTEFLTQIMDHLPPLAKPLQESETRKKLETNVVSFKKN